MESLEKNNDLHALKKKYDKMQIKYGAKELDAIYYGGCIHNPDVCFVFMNPTGRNIASEKTWCGPKYPWLGTKNIWKLFHSIHLIDDELYDEILKKRPKDWDYDFCEKVYRCVEEKHFFITNLGKCTQLDARPLSDATLSQYLKLLFREIDIIKPKIIITFGNQVSSIFLNEKITVSTCRKKYYEREIHHIQYKVFPVFYPVGNGIFNIEKAIEDIKFIINHYIEK